MHRHAEISVHLIISDKSQMQVNFWHFRNNEHHGKIDTAVP
jgi:hypothetical protein